MVTEVPQTTVVIMVGSDGSGDDDFSPSWDIKNSGK